MKCWFAKLLMVWRRDYDTFFQPNGNPGSILFNHMHLPITEIGTLTLYQVWFQNMVEFGVKNFVWFVCTSIESIFLVQYLLDSWLIRLYTPLTASYLYCTWFIGEVSKYNRSHSFQPPYIPQFEQLIMEVWRGSSGHDILRATKTLGTIHQDCGSWG